jgi:hypothetical protein
MKTLKESLLDNIDDIINRGENDLKDNLNIPKIKDFERNPHFKKMVGVTWMCPDILRKYKQEYPDMVLPEYQGIEFSLDTSIRGGRIVPLYLYFKTEKAFVSSKRFISGWDGHLTGSNLSTYKKMIINVITKLANNPKLMDELMKHAYKVKRNTPSIGDTDIKDIFSLINK